MARVEQDAKLRRNLRRVGVFASWCFGLALVFFLAGSVLSLLSDGTVSTTVLPSVSVMLLIGVMVRLRGTVRLRHGAIEMRPPQTVTALVSFAAAIAFMTPAVLRHVGLSDQSPAAPLSYGYVGVGIAFGVLGIVMLFAPAQLIADSEGLRHRQRMSRRYTWHLGWDDMLEIDIAPSAAAPPLSLPVRITSRSAANRTATTRQLAHPMWVLIEWLEHYRDHPEDRAELATQAGVDRLECIYAELYDPSVKPAWLPPPRRAEDRG